MFLRSMCIRTEATPRRVRGPINLEYITESDRRRQAQYKRKKGLLKAALEFHILTGCDIHLVLNEPKCGRTVFGTGALQDMYKAGTLRSLASDNIESSDTITASNKMALPPLPNTPPKTFPSGVRVPNQLRSFMFTDGVSPEKVAKTSGPAPTQTRKGRGKGRAASSQTTKKSNHGKGRGRGRGRGSS
ncbi:PREDICTED: uncharacterized protein LOC109487284 [Branchiostoma belcheri]|uniref:Uncharacterized protein LOC109487284 n=1 Tax=Branchiostoma belcheri TaxID=7741 RepID=A0A6P5A0F4_BRABE|nr:PREDICTED: uncharacterized protein LOC109487284 [Branchiostoma belcheri]